MLCIYSMTKCSAFLMWLFLTCCGFYNFSTGSGFYDCTVMVFLDHIVDLIMGTSQCDLELNSRLLF